MVHDPDIAVGTDPMAQYAIRAAHALLVSDAAVVRAATDQPVLHPRSPAGEQLVGYHTKDMFSMMRENDLVGSYVFSNYLLGRAPPAFDILHCNARSTRLPARMLTDFLAASTCRKQLGQTWSPAPRGPANRLAADPDTLLRPFDH
jgi:hypothetical protein